MTRKTWYNISADAGTTPVVYLYSEIGAWGITAIDFIKDFTAAVGDSPSVDVRINSPGGDLFDAIAMHSFLQAAPQKVNVHIDGYAASAASVVALAGDTVNMPSNAYIMIHLPATATYGTADDHRASAGVLDQLRDTLVNIYAEKTGLTGEEIVNMLTAETWLNAERAFELKFATNITKPVKVAALAGMVNFKSAPQINVKEDVMNEAEIRANIAAEFKARTDEIVALCKLAGKPAAAADYLASDKTAAEVRAELLAAAPVSAEIINPAPDPVRASASLEAAAALDPIKIYARWNRKGR